MSEYVMIALSIYRFDIEPNHTVQCENLDLYLIQRSTIHIPFQVFIVNVYSRYGFPWFPTKSGRDPIIAFIISFFFWFLVYGKKTELFTSFDKNAHHLLVDAVYCLFKTKWKKNCCQNHGNEVDYSRSLPFVNSLFRFVFHCWIHQYSTI